MKEYRKPLARAINHALGAGMVAGLAMAAVPAVSQDNDEAAAGLVRAQVTGSRIKRADAASTTAVSVIDRETIELSGESNAADLIRNLPLNIAGSYRPQSGSSFGGVSLVDLRGLGASRTLVLINGRRMPKAPLTGVSSDLGMIPLGAIERIEILSDSGSAVYGSDAIGGVVNVILRSDFEGAEIMIGRADVDPSGGDRREGYATFGAISGTSSLTGGVSTNSRDIIFGRDFPWYTPGASLYSNNFTTLDFGFDSFNWTALPGSCDFNGAWSITPSSDSLSGESCAYNFALGTADEASINNSSAFLRASHNFTDNWSVFSDVMVAKTQSFGRYAPVPDTSYFSSPPTISPNSPNNPTNPDSPMYDPTLGLDPQPVNIWHRFDALGNRDNYIDSELYDLLVGVQAYVGPAEVEFGARWTRNKVFDIGYNYLVRSTAFDYIEDGRYDLSDPYGMPDNILNAMKATVSRISVFDQNEVFGSVGFDAGNLRGTPIQWFIGAEYREEIYADQYDSLSEAGQITGSSGSIASSSAGGERDVTSVFGEVLLPVLDNFEVSVAARFDDYSDYGSDFSPRISFGYEPLDGYVLRGSWGEGFRAPGLPALTRQAALSETFVIDRVCQAIDPLAHCNPQINEFIQANPALDSEQSEQLSLGVAFAPLDWFSGSLDYANIEISDRIRSFNAQQLLDIEATGQPLPPGLAVVRDGSGGITRIDSGFGNQGRVNASFFDLNLGARFDVLNGDLLHKLNVVRLQTMSVDGGRQLVRDPGVPRHRAALENRYAWGDFSVAYNLNYISGQCDRIVADECVGRVPSWITHDAQMNYSTPWNGRITVGAQNLWNRQPALGVGNLGSRAYDFDLYDGFGRTTYVRYTQSF